MADLDRRVNRNEVQIKDVLDVGSRISWGAVLAGAVVALVVSLILTLLGSAIGLSVADATDGSTIGTGAAIWAIVTMIVALFIGGWVTSQCEVGETKSESALHGIVMWGATSALLVALAIGGISSGFGAMMQVANASRNVSTETWQSMALGAGISQEQIDELAASVSERARDPNTAERVREGAATSAWWAFIGAVLSIVAAVCGSILGAGPEFRLVPIPIERRSYSGI